MLSSAWLWFIGGLLLVGGEIVLPGVYLLWIGLGAFVVGLLLALFPELSLTWQLVIFALAMLGTISLGFVIQRRGLSPAPTELNQELQGLVGNHYVAASDFQVGKGRVRVGDTTYGAVSDDAIQAGDTVKVVAVVLGRLRVARVG
ncbi:MAG TPA: NfeD family protein [Chromatiaceae bacterium]|nr:NfeD family protein [Chromatiaceae bacterium]